MILFQNLYKVSKFKFILHSTGKDGNQSIFDQDEIAILKLYNKIMCKIDQKKKSPYASFL